MRRMALTPETASALKQALEAVIQECGDTPGYEDLVAKLQDAEQAIPAEHAAPEHGAPAHDAPEGEDAPPAEDASADEMFAHAEKQHTAKRKAAKGDHANPFADKGNA